MQDGSHAGPRHEVITLVAAAVAVAVIQIALAVSLAALVFPGDLAPALPRALGAFMLGGLLATLLIGWRSSYECMMAGTQDTATVIVAVMVASAAADVAANDRPATMLVLVALTTLITGLAMYVAGRLRLGSAVRYIPAPVIGGFMAGTGWLLVRGGFDVLLDRAVELDEVVDLFAWNDLKFWLPGFALAVFIAAGTKMGWHPIFITGLLIITTAAFYVVAGSSSSVDDVEADGWLLGPFDSSASWRPLTSEVGDADWGAIAGQALSIGAVALVAIVGLLLNMSALETTAATDIDLDNELRVAGGANILGGLGGGAPSYHLLGDTLLARSLGARGRLAPAIAGGLALLALVLGIGTVAMVPRILPGGMLMALGMSLMVRWVEGLRWRQRSDQVVELTVLGTIAVLGVLEGVAVGIALAAAIFIARYSAIDPIRDVRDGSLIASHVDRPGTDRAILDAAASQVATVRLHGYLFFGSVGKVAQTLRGLASNPDDPLTHLVVDVTGVTGIDMSAVQSLDRSLGALADTGVDVVVCGLDDSTRALHRIENATVAVDLDRAVERAENQILAAAGGPDTDAPPAPGMPDAFYALPIVEIDAGVQLFATGERATAMYAVDEGELSVWFDRDGGKPMRIRRIGPGAIVGELGFLNGEPRSATVVADTPVRLRELTYDHLEVLQETDRAEVAALNEALVAHLASRLGSTNKTIEHLGF